MPTAGIIAEYNPFHTGHAWHVAETRRRLGADTAIVCAMSGNWVQRGECALLDKWSRAELALRGGVDLVLELPTVWAASSAESFARGGVGVLSATGVVDVLSFGSETGALDDLRLVAACLNRPEYHTEVRRLVRGWTAFPTARQSAAQVLLEREGENTAAMCLSRPNDNLAIEYLRALPSEIAALAVPRMGVGHDGRANGEFASASYLRALLRMGKEEEAIPYLMLPPKGPLASLERCERVILDRIRTMEEEDWEALPDNGGPEGLPARLVRCARTARSVEECLTLAKTKRYTHARLRRLLLWAFLGLTTQQRPEVPPYLRVLGFNGRGRELLAQMKHSAHVPVLTKAAHAHTLEKEGRDLFTLEARCTDRYTLCLPEVRPCGWEWCSNPVRLP